MIRAARRLPADRRQQLELLANGKCSAGSRRHFGNLRYFPMIEGEFIEDPESEEGFDTNHDAVRAARRFKEQCQQTLAEANGSM
jgi:hypothetical protein